MGRIPNSKFLENNVTASFKPAKASSCLCPSIRSHPWLLTRAGFSLSLPSCLWDAPSLLAPAPRGLLDIPQRPLGVKTGGKGCVGRQAGPGGAEGVCFCPPSWGAGGCAGGEGKGVLGSRGVTPGRLRRLISSPRVLSCTSSTGFSCCPGAGGGRVMRMGRNRPGRKASDSLGDVRMTPGLCHQRLG